VTKPNALIIGGTNGIGLMLAKLLLPTHHPLVTGRDESNVDVDSGIDFQYLDLSENPNYLGKDLDSFCAPLPKFDLVIYAAGYSQPARLSGLQDHEIDEMVGVGFTACAKILRRIAAKQGVIPGLILIGSSAQYVPLERHLMYRVSKRALAYLGECLSLDPAFPKVMVFAPGGVNGTGFREDQVVGYLEASHVAETILRMFTRGNFAYEEVLMGHEKGLPDLKNKR
jgi:short-subunit dehydrogenase